MKLAVIGPRIVRVLLDEVEYLEQETGNARQ